MMNQVPIVYYHNEDMDGCFAAYAAYQAYGPEGAEYIGLRAGQEVPVQVDREVVVLDLGLSLANLAALREASKSLLVIDHHASSAAAYATAPECVVFDPSHAACVLAWQRFKPREPVPEIYQYVEDRDLWRFKLPLSREINAALSSQPFTWQWAECCLNFKGRLATDGAAILRWIDREVERLVDMAIVQDLAGHPAAIVNCPWKLGSEVGEALLKRFPNCAFAATFYVSADGSRVWQLRSRKLTDSGPGFDVGELARNLGGGGHPPAAGCTAPPGDPYFQNAIGPARPDGSATEPAEPIPTASAPTQNQVDARPAPVPPAENPASAGRLPKGGRR
jgi:hypothetical protein